MPSPVARANAASILTKQFLTTPAHILTLQQRVPHQPKVFWSNTSSENEVQMFSPIPISSFRSINSSSSSSSNGKTTSPPEISPEDLLLLIQRAVGHEITNNNNQNATVANKSYALCDWRRAISILTKSINYCGVIPSWKCYELTLAAACDSFVQGNQNQRNDDKVVVIKGSWAAALSCICALSYSAESLGSFSRIVLPMLLMMNQRKVVSIHDSEEVAKRGVEESFKFLNAILINNSNSGLHGVNQLVDNVGVRKVLQQALQFSTTASTTASTTSPNFSTSSSWSSALTLFPHLWSAGALDATNVELLLKIVVKSANSNNNNNMWLSAIRLAWLHTSPMKTALSPTTAQDLMKLLLNSTKKSSSKEMNANWMIALQVATKNNSLVNDEACSPTSSDESNQKMIVALALAESSTFSRTVSMKFCLIQLRKQQLSESFFELTNKILRLQEHNKSSSLADFSKKWIDLFAMSKNTSILTNSTSTSKLIPSFCRTLLIMKCQLRSQQLFIESSISHCLKKTVLEKKTITCESNNFNDILLAVVLTCAEFVARGSKLDETKFIPIEQISDKVVEEIMKTPFVSQHLHRKIRIGGMENLGSALQISHFFPSCVPGFSLLDEFVFGQNVNHKNNNNLKMKNEEAPKIIMNISPSEILILSLISYSARYSPPGGFASDASYLMKRFHKSFAASHRLRCALMYVWCTTMNVPDHSDDQSISYSQQLSKIALDIFELEIANEHHERQPDNNQFNHRHHHHTILNLFSLVAQSLRPLHSSEAIKTTIERRVRFVLFSSSILSIGNHNLENNNIKNNFKITNSLKWISFAPNSTSMMRQVFCHELPMTATLHHLPYQDFGEKFCSFALAPSPKNTLISMNFYIDAAVACGEIGEAWKCHRMKLAELSKEESSIGENNNKKHAKLFEIMDEVLIDENENDYETKKLKVEGTFRKIKEFSCDASTSDSLKLSILNLILCQNNNAGNIFFNSSSAYLFPYRSSRKMFQLIQEILSTMSSSSLHSVVTSIHHRDSDFLKYFIDLTMQNLFGIGLSFQSQQRMQNDQNVSGIPTKSFLTLFSEVVKCFENIESGDSSKNILNSILESIFATSLEKISIARKKAFSYEIHNISDNSVENEQQSENISLSTSSSDYLTQLEKLLVRFYMSWFVSSYSRLVLNSNQNNHQNYFFVKAQREKLEKSNDESLTTSNNNDSCTFVLESKDQILLLATKLANYLATRFISNNTIQDIEKNNNDKNNTLVVNKVFVFHTFGLIDSASIWLSTVPTLLEYTLTQISLLNHDEQKESFSKLQNLTSSMLQTLLHGGDSIFCQLKSKAQSLTVFMANQETHNNNNDSSEMYKILLRKIDRILLRSSKLYKNIFQSSQFSNLASKQRRDALNFLLDRKQLQNSQGREFLLQLFESWSRLANNDAVAQQTITNSTNKTLIVTLLRSQKELLGVGGNLSRKNQREKDFQDLWDSLLESKFNRLIKMSSSAKRKLSGHVPSTLVVQKNQKLLSEILYETNVPIDVSKSSGRGTRSLLTSFQASRVLHLMKVMPSSNDSENNSSSWKPAFDALCWVSNSFHNKEAIMTSSIEDCSKHLARCGRIVECCKLLEMFVLNNSSNDNNNNHEQDDDKHATTNISSSKIQKERFTIFLGDIMTSLAKFQSQSKSAEESDSTLLEALKALRNFSRQSLDSQIAFAVRALENEFAGSIKNGSGSFGASQNFERVEKSAAIPPSDSNSSSLPGQKREVIITETQQQQNSKQHLLRNTKFTKQMFVESAAPQKIVWTTQRKNALLPYLDYLTKNAPPNLPDDRRTTSEAHRKKFLADIKPFEYVVFNAFAKKDFEGQENVDHSQQQILPMQLAWLWYRHEGKNRQHLFRLKETYDRVEDTIYQIFGKLCERKNRSEDDKSMTRNKIVAKELIGSQLEVIEKLEYLSRRVGMKLKNVTMADEESKLLLLQQEAILNEKWAKFFDEKCPLLKGTKCEGQLRACRMLINVLKPNIVGEAEYRTSTASLNNAGSFKKAEADLEKVAKNNIRTSNQQEMQSNTDKEKNNHQSSSMARSITVAENLLHQALRLQQSKSDKTKDSLEKVLVDFGKFMKNTDNDWKRALSSIDKVISNGENMQKPKSENTKQQVVESWWRMALEGMN